MNTPDAEQQVVADGETLTVREFIRRWGAAGRGYRVRERIDSDLRRLGLRTEPPYDEVAIDTPIRVVRPEPVGGHASEAPTSGTINAPEPSEVGLHVGLLPAASAGVESIKREQDLTTALTTMFLSDYSQLVVVTGADTYWGVISWESIGRTRVSKPTPTILQASVQPAMVDPRDDLIALVPRIYSEGFVIVRDPLKPIRAGGIITTADLTLQFADLATPFFLLGEAERRIRRRVDMSFVPSELKSAVDPQDDREVASAADLTLGELQRLIEDPSNWEKLNWTIDRKVFLKSLGEVKELRNEVMHFNPDPIEEKDVASLKAFVSALRHLP